MTRHDTSLFELAVRTWPRDYRRDNGEELVATAHELADGRSTIREALSLATAGLRRRFRDATNESPGALWIGALRFGLFVSLTVFLSQFMGVLLLGETGNLTGRWWWTFPIVGIVVLSTSMLVLALATPRLGAMALTALGVGLVLWGPDVPRTNFTILIASHLAAVWFLASRGQRADWRIVGRMTAAAVGAALIGLALGNFWFGSTGLVFAVTLVAAVIAPVDPRLLAGMCCYWALTYVFVALWHLTEGELAGPGAAAVIVPPLLIGLGALGATRAARPRLT